MASLFTHALVGWTLGKVSPKASEAPRLGLLCAACACLPDADVVGFALGIRYEDLLGHRGLSHSIPFAVLFGLGVVALVYRRLKPFSSSWWQVTTCVVLATISHGLLDGLTDGGLGVAFFSPFENGRYFFPWQPIAVSPIGIGAFFSRRGLEVMANEMLWIWTPTLLLLLSTWIWRRRSAAT